MARRYLLIEFDDEATANTLRGRIDEATRKGKKYRVVGLFAKPGPDFCRCGEDLPYDPHVYERGRKYIASKVGRRLGWRVCLECKKPLAQVGALKNMLEPEDIIDPDVHIGRPYKGVRYNLMFHFLSIGAPTRAVPSKK